MKRYLFIIAAISLLTIETYAQMRIQQNGQVSLGTLSSAMNTGVQVTPSYTCFNSTSTHDWSWISISRPKNVNAKSWIVTDNQSLYHHVFSVTGTGSVYYKHLLNRAIDGDTEDSRSADFVSINGEEALNIIGHISGFYFQPQNMELPNLEDNEFVNKEAIPELLADYSKRTVELSSKEMSEVFPDAVRTDSDGHRCIDYNSVVVMLVEAIKEQQREIEELRSIVKPGK